MSGSNVHALLLSNLAYLGRMLHWTSALARSAPGSFERDYARIYWWWRVRMAYRAWKWRQPKGTQVAWVGQPAHAGWRERPFYRDFTFWTHRDSLAFWGACASWFFCAYVLPSADCSLLNLYAWNYYSGCNTDEVVYIVRSASILWKVGKGEYKQQLNA